MLQIFLFATIAVFGLVEAQPLQCCPSGQVVSLKETDPYFCWDPKLNKTATPVALKCNGSDYVTEREIDFYINSADQLVFTIPNVEIEYDPGTFCVGNRTTTLKSKNVTRTVRYLLVCPDEDLRTINDEVFGYCMVVSTILLVITAVIYIALPELHDLQGKSIINLCLSLGIGLGIIAAMKLVSYTDMGLCATRGFLAYFFIIASFFWMNAISVQILFSIRRPMVLNYGWKEFLYYAVYAWGCAATLAIIMAIINFIPGNHLKPGLGLNHCWFYNTKQQWYYMYSVMSILTAINILIFLYISIDLWRNSFKSTHVKALRFKFMMTLKMAIVMGVAWSFEMIGSLNNSNIVWEILDIMNSLQGVLICLVLVVFRKKVIKCMYKHGWLDCVSGRVEKYLAVGEDEEDVIEHTIGVTLDETKNNKQ